MTITVPLDHFTSSDSRSLPVTFAVLAATGRRQGMFVTVTGGPGPTSGIASADSYTAAFDPQIPRRFDIVFFDQRGMALSGGLACPQAAAAYYQGDGRGQTAKQEAALKNGAQAFSAGCTAETAHPEWLPYLGTDQAVEDLEQFRKLMGDDKFWLYGESYGTQYAQTYAAGHGSRLAGLILDGTVDLTLDGFQFLAQQAQAFNDTLTAALRACNDDPACKADMRQRRGRPTTTWPAASIRARCRSIFRCPMAARPGAASAFPISKMPPPARCIPKATACSSTAPWPPMAPAATWPRWPACCTSRWASTRRLWRPSPTPPTPTPSTTAWMPGLRLSRQLA